MRTRYGGRSDGGRKLKAETGEGFGGGIVVGSREGVTTMTFGGERVEWLEPRIAPASFLMTAGGDIVDADGNVVADDPANTIVGADKGVLFQKSDNLYFDTNGDGVIDPKVDALLLSVRGAAGVVFFDNLGGDLPLDVTGVAAAKGFGATFLTSIHGDVATMLETNAKGAPTPYTFVSDQIVAGAGISGLTVGSTGEPAFVAGSVLAGGSITKITITGADGGVSVQGIYAGTG